MFDYSRCIRWPLVFFVFLLLFSLESHNDNESLLVKPDGPSCKLVTLLSSFTINLKAKTSKHSTAEN